MTYAAREVEGLTLDKELDVYTPGIVVERLQAIGPALRALADREEP